MRFLINFNGDVGLSFLLIEERFSRYAGVISIMEYPSHTLELAGITIKYFNISTDTLFIYSTFELHIYRKKYSNSFEESTKGSPSHFKMLFVLWRKFKTHKQSIVFLNLPKFKTTKVYIKAKVMGWGFMSKYSDSILYL